DTKISSDVKQKIGVASFPFFETQLFFGVEKKKQLSMLAFDDDNEGEEKTLNNEKEAFSNSGCYDKDWVLSTNEQQKLNTLICCLCNQIANKAVELQCDEHENIETTY
ncbi:hypothetical protein RFI_36163, partial [Reticulomyxa filosa]